MHRFLPAIKERVQLAESICAEENENSKQKMESSWFSQMAEAADLELDEELIKQFKKEDAPRISASQNRKIVLQRLLSEPLRPIGSKRKFRQIHQEINDSITKDGEYRSRDATADLMTKTKKHSLKRFRKR